MTNNEPDLQNGPNLPVQTSFLYDSHTHEIYGLEPAPALFFGSHLASGTVPPFRNAFSPDDGARFHSLWTDALDESEHGTIHFSFDATSPENSYTFLFTLNPAAGLLTHPSHRMVSVTRLAQSPFRPTSLFSHHKEYTEFIELAAHDLDSPLRKLSVLLERIAKKSEAAPDETMNNYLQRAANSVADMRGMIDALTLLARLGAASPAADECDLAAIIRKAITELDIPDDVLIIQEGAPNLRGDAGQYTILFKQLIENAYKFREPNRPSRITIDHRIIRDEEKKEHGLPLHDTFVSIEVSDNGIGFRNEHAGRIFLPFVRLNGKSEYPGSGIGLAISKTVVKNHGGIIHAQDSEGFGAKFTLILPITPI